MILKTKFHGDRVYEESDIILFKNGLPGFEHLKKFIIFETDENKIFSILHSVEDDGVGLVIVSPFSIFKDYEFEIDDDSLKEIKVEKPQDLEIYNTVTLNSDINKTTVNLKAPIVINKNEKLGEQIILDNSRYKIKHPFFKEEV